MSLLRSGVFIVGAKRTAFGAYGASFLNKTCTDLAEIASRAALTEAKVDPAMVETAIFGNVIQSNRDTSYLARHASLRVGLADHSRAVTVNRLCGSGFQSAVNGAQEIQLGEANLALVGGSENMSEAPFSVWNVRFGTRFGVDYKFEDVLWGALTDHHIKTPMGVTAENLAVKYNITREDCDAYALESQLRWKAAAASGVFTAETVPVTVKGKKGPVEVLLDEHPRVTSAETLARLPTVFKKGGAVTAGNASGVSDGAGALVLASEQAISQFSLKPLARIVGYATVGCDPSLMGIGPVPAIKNLLKATSLSINDIDILEVNEAFASQYLACEKELGLDRARTNINGGAIAMGHPVGASGARILAHLTHELHRKKVKLALGSACIGGGQGIAMLLERVD